MNVGFACFQDLREQVFFVDVAQGFVHARFAYYQQPRIGAFNQLGFLLVFALRDVQPLDVAARYHHAENGAFG